MTYPYVPARWKTVTSGRHPTLIVLHAMQSPEKPTGAEACANYFKTTDRKASAHLCIDNNSIVRSVLDKDVAYAAKHANARGLHIEHAGYSAQSAQDWRDPFSDGMLSLSAVAARKWCDTYDIPVTFLDAKELRAGKPGITTHAQVEKAFPSSGHWDPGPNFPIDYYLTLVDASVFLPKEFVMPVVNAVAARRCPEDGGIQILQGDGAVFNTEGCKHYYGSWFEPGMDAERKAHPDRRFIDIIDHPSQPDTSHYCLVSHDGAFYEF